MRHDRLQNKKVCHKEKNVNSSQDKEEQTFQNISCTKQLNRITNDTILMMIDPFIRI